ncbi:PLDc N-terminal domain-containing protein [Pseudomonas capsici]|uniref:PLDc N-terminal domain-containing protein n=1 Tax=Pseudomonas capsici TaxID=2810614 RepID=A0ABT3C3K0_9PSED|nr:MULTISPECIES: PLDc N-terminal domain-containing protein [Pseudomonas]MBX8476331.1 PLDc N-terminal domain-containing protein [Pseudomonas cichorii]MBX8609247.1 PLDc N-terminal domain-containing protein [Pseudomonas cichorii]MBX8613828.1 PLDc N-terminal domain-containing protein [Pseudomonas cichorii]MCV4265266.1 PLDc N-terminal domain-containing protein [Pseudomonas capsici]MCV4270194.1 PLDc N-terminal domain-containing protein [Pseudomonas capsici]
MPWISESGLWLFALLVALIVLADIWAVLRVRKSETSSSNKLLWIVVIVAVPVIGVLLWVLTGPRHVSRPANPAQEASKY